MKISRMIIGMGCLLLSAGNLQAQDIIGKKTYNSYRGLVMAGYQGWFNTPDDGADRSWRHYGGPKFGPGVATVEMWPDTKEYKKLYTTKFQYEDGTYAKVFSSHDASTTDTHFRWMKKYGLDGVFMQRFVSEVRGESGRNHFNHVLHNAMNMANKYDRAISIMYDLSGMRHGEAPFVLSDIKQLAEEYHLFDHQKNPSYLYHNGKPLVAVWGVGFNDGRGYDTGDCAEVIDGMRKMGFSIMIGVPTYWREQGTDCLKEEALTALIKRCDIVMPWFVARYDDKSFKSFSPLIDKDIQWAKDNHIDYAPLCFPGFSWDNLKYPEPGPKIPRNKGQFLQDQIDYSLQAGAQMLYIAMFDEIDEGTAIFKIARKVPVAQPRSTFVPLEEGIKSDHYLKIVGKAAKRLKKNQ